MRGLWMSTAQRWVVQIGWHRKRNCAYLCSAFLQRQWGLETPSYFEVFTAKCRSAWCILVLKTMLQSFSDRSLFLPVLQVCRHFRACWRVDSWWHFGPILTQVSMKISCDSILKAVWNMLVARHRFSSEVQLHCIKCLVHIPKKKYFPYQSLNILHHHPSFSWRKRSLLEIIGVTTAAPPW